MTNRPSFEEIDYTIRPAKCIERKMIGEMIGALHVFQPVNKYVYVGLGSTFFTDFVLYHKMFGICDMFSIEKEVTRRQRIEFNIPFECIDVQYGETTDVLPRLHWQYPAIVWLDYDKEIDYRKQDDLVFLSQNLQSSSLLMVTMRTENGDFDKKKSPPNLDIRLQSLRDSLRNKIPDLTKYEVGDLIEVKLLLSRLPLIGLIVYGRVSRVSKIGQEEYEIGVVFLDIEDDVKEMLWRYILDRQRATLRKQVDKDS